MHFTLGLALAVSSALSGSSLQTQAAVITAMPQAQTVEEYVREYFAATPILAEIARCESRFKQFDKDGSIHRGVVNSLDLGIMQVNEHYHGKAAKKLGLDLYTIQGNLAYGKYLYDKEGTQPWSASKPCWGKTEVVKAHAGLAVNKN